MPMKTRLKRFIKGLSFKDALLGAMVGLILSAAIQPFALAFFTDIWVEVGAPGHTPPTVEARMSQLESSNTPGQTVDGYGNLTWREGFEEYRVVIENQGSKPAYDIETRIPFPGCIVSTSTDTPFTEQEPTLTDQISVEVGGSSPDKTYECSKVINTDRLFPDETVVVDFIIRDQFEECAVLGGFHDGTELITQYRWRKANQMYTNVVFDSESSIRNEFDKFREENPGVIIEAGTPYGRSYGVLIRYNVSDVAEPRSVIGRCGLQLPNGSR